jgi:DNA-3-methyladenine glycosylase
MRSRILPLKFFKRSALLVAPELLGKYLVLGNKKLIITETEAYDGHDDKASHASRGKTKRNAPMFESGGGWYVYLCYGMYWMLNIVTGDKNYPSAVLIRGVEGFVGPGKLTKHFGITRKFNGKPADKKTGLWIEDRGMVISSRQTKRSSRIGVAYAGPVWSKKKWRFQLTSKNKP